MLLQTVFAVALIATDTAVPSPQPSIPTIIEVHSSPYCTALHQTVVPALVGLMRNDALIKVGLSAILRMDHDFKYGGEMVTSWNQQGAATHTQLPGKVQLFDDRLQQTASALQHNVTIIDAILANTDDKLKPRNADEQASLASIKAQLAKVAGQQKTAVNLINGTAESQELDEIFNNAITEAPSDAIAIQPWHADTLNGLSPLEAMLSKGVPPMNIAGDPTLKIKAETAKAQASAPLRSPYEPFIEAVTDDQLLIGSYESMASKSIIAGAAGCK